MENYLFISVTDEAEAETAVRRWSMPAFLLRETWDEDFPWTRVLMPVDHEAPESRKSLPGDHLLISVWYEPDDGWGFALESESGTVSRYSMRWANEKLSIDRSRLRLDDLTAALLALPRVHDRLSVATDEDTTVRSIARVLRDLLVPPEGIEALLEGDPPPRFAELLGLAPFDDASFESLLELYRSDRETFDAMYPGATAIGLDDRSVFSDS
jgi:hypothetical protein